MSRSQNITAQITPTLANNGVTTIVSSVGKSPLSTFQRYTGGVYPTGQAVTIQVFGLVGTTLRLEASYSCPAGTLTTFDVTPASPQHTVQVLNGPTGPSALDITAQGIQERD